MSFASPSILLLLPIAPLIVAWWLRRRKPAFRYADTNLVNDLPSRRGKIAEWLSAGLRGMIILCVLLALAGPRYPDRSTRLPTEGIAILFVCDVSGSMAESDFVWTGGTPPISRIDAAKRAFKLFVAGGTVPDGQPFAGRSGDQIGLVVFAAWPHTECPLTLNHTVLLAVLDSHKPKEAGLDSGTNIGDSIAEGLIRLKPVADRKRVMIVLSDGEHNATKDGPDSPYTPRQAAQLAANLGVTVYTIDCGGDPKADATPEERAQRTAGRETLKSVADITGGKSFTANSGDDLRDVYRAIDELERRPIISFNYRRYHELFPSFCIAAFASLVVLVLLESFAWRRLP